MSNVSYTSIVSISLKSESGDSYLFLFTDVTSPEDFLEKLEESLSEDLRYIYEFDIVTDDGMENAFKAALKSHIKGL